MADDMKYNLNSDLNVNTDSKMASNPPAPEKEDLSLSSLLEKNYSSTNLFQARKMLDQGRVTLSFVKGKLDSFLIISGIVAENNTNYEAKVSFKKANNKLSTTCSCILPQPCHHTGSLFLKYDIVTKQKNKIDQTSSASRVLALDGVHVQQYGQIIKSAHLIPGAKTNSTFSSLQYLLTNRKVVHFPAPSKWKGQLSVNIIPATDLHEYRKTLMAEGKYTYLFSLTHEGETIHEVSIFDILYLFNWKTGEALDFSTELRGLISTLKHLDEVCDIQELMRVFLPLKDKNILKLQFQGEDWENFPEEEVHFRFSVNSSPRKNFLNLELEAFTSDQNKVPIPSPFLLFVSEQGWAGSFRTKSDMTNFIKVLIEDFSHETFFYKKYIHRSSKKNLIIEWITLLMSRIELSFFDPKLKKVFILNTQVFKKIFTSLFDSFGELGFRTSFYVKDERKVFFQIPKNALLDGIAAFYRYLSPLNITLFYNQQQIRNWKSSIRFDRNHEKLDWFQLDLIINDEDLDVIKKAQVNDNFIITDKGLLLISDKEKDLLRFMKRYTKFDGKKEDSSKYYSKFNLFLQRSRIFELFELKKLGIEGALTQEEQEFCENILSMKNMPQYQLPERYQEIIRPYQREGYNWLRFLHEHKFGACLADDMGLGKTLQTIMLLQSLKKEIKKVLIICPVSILYNWKNELDKFSDLTYSIYYGDSRDYQADAQIILTSYGLMKKESYSTLGQDVYDILIFDEVQHLKNIRSLGANSARNLKAKFRVCLTGTPVENDLSEFYNIMDICVPGVWGNLGTLKSISKSNSRLLARKTVKPFILRRTKEQVLKDLPEKVETNVYLEFSEEEQNFYQNKLLHIRSHLQNSGNKRYGEILKFLLELRQLCLWQQQTQLQSTKLEFLMENLEQLAQEGHKALVFSQFTTYLDFIENKIKVAGLKIARIDGSQAIKKRNEQVELFQEGDAQVFLISLKAGGFGLNLTAASYIFLMDPWWNPAVERQAIDRAHRIGQENKLTVLRPIIKNSIEEKVLILQDSKRELFKDLMAEDDDQYFSGKLTMDDFQHLIY